MRYIRENLEHLYDRYGRSLTPQRLLAELNALGISRQEVRDYMNNRNASISDQKVQEDLRAAYLGLERLL
jgi:hypothetical protein